MTIEEDRTDDSAWMKHRNHHYDFVHDIDGNEQMKQQIQKHFKMPTTKNDTLRFVQTTYLSQVSTNHGIVYKQDLKIS